MELKNSLQLHRTLLRSGIPYVAIGNYFNAGHDVNGIMAILTPVPDSIIQLLGMERDRSYDNLITYKHDFSESAKLSIAIYAKGQGLYTDKFETELLERAVVDNEYCRIPDYESQHWMLLYRSIIHQGMFPPDYRKVMIQKLAQRTGIARPKFKHVGYYPRYNNVSEIWQAINKQYDESNLNCGW